MPFSVEVCDDSDFDRLLHIISDTFQHTQPYIDAVFPNHDTPAGHARGRDQLLGMKRSDPNMKFLKAVDSETRHIVGQAHWLVLEKSPAGERLEGAFWEDENEKEFSQQLFAQYLVPRTQAFNSASGPIVVLDMLSIDPQYQNSGAGSMLMKWGLGVADRMGVDAVVESTMNAVRFYEKHGFQSVEEMKFDLPRKYADKAKPQLLFMRRLVRQKGL